MNTRDTQNQSSNKNYKDTSIDKDEGIYIKKRSNKDNAPHDENKKKISKENKI